MPATPSDCGHVTDLLDAYADGELSGAAAAEVGAHVAGCGACAAELGAIRALRRQLAALRADTAPDALRESLAARLPARTWPSPSRRAVPALAAGLAGLLLGAGGMLLASGRRAAADLVEHDLLAAHARSLLAEAPPQVASGDPHRLRPWLSARLPAAPRVEDVEGYPLLGARMDLVASRPVVALLYRRNAHAVTVFAAPEPAAADWPTAPGRAGGFRFVPWTADGVRYVAISDLTAGELDELVARLRAG